MTQRKAGEYGFEDTSLRAMGGEPGVKRLVDRFFALMETLPEAREILEMHPEDLVLSREKLTAFLTGWLGGPKRFSERWGPIRIPAAHAHLGVTEQHRDAWLLCMDRAVDEMDVPADFPEYFKREIRVPAERVTRVQACPGQS